MNSLNYNLLAYVDSFLDNRSSLRLAATCKDIKSKMNFAFFNRCCQYYSSMPKYIKKINWQKLFNDTKTGKRIYELVHNGNYNESSLACTTSGKISFIKTGFFFSSIFHHPQMIVCSSENKSDFYHLNHIDLVNVTSLDNLKSEKSYFYNNNKTIQTIQTVIINRHRINVLEMSNKIVKTEIFDLNNKKITEIHDILHSDIEHSIFFSTVTDTAKKSFFVIRPTNIQSIYLYNKRDTIDLSNSKPIKALDINGYSILGCFNQEIFIYKNTLVSFDAPEVKICNIFETRQYKRLTKLDSFVRKKDINYSYFGLLKMIGEDSFIIGCKCYDETKAIIVKYNASSNMQTLWNLETIVGIKIVNDYTTTEDCLILSCADNSIVLFYSDSMKFKIDINHCPTIIFSSYDKIIFQTLRKQEMILWELADTLKNKDHKVRGLELVKSKSNCTVF